MTAPAADPVAAYLETPRALLARMAEVRGHIEDMSSDERVLMLGALAGSLKNLVAMVEAVRELGQRESTGIPPVTIRKAIESALRDAQGAGQ